MNAILLDADGNEVDRPRLSPQRVGVPRVALDRLAALVGAESPAGQMAACSRSLDGLGDRLGGVGLPVDKAQLDPEPDLDPDSILVAAGLLADDAPTEVGNAVLTVWHGAALAIEVEMLLSLHRGRVRVRCWHRNLHDWVVCVSTADGQRFELSWLSVEDWWLELGRAAWVELAHLRHTPAGESLPEVIETPWELLLGTGEAVQRDRGDLLAAMVSDYSGTTLAGGASEPLVAAADADVRLWHEQLETTARGRLHAAVMGRSERGRPGAGLVEWVLFSDGWRSLTPVRREGWNMVRIEQRGPTDLARELAVRAAEVTS